MARIRYRIDFGFVGCNVEDEIEIPEWDDLDAEEQRRAMDDVIETELWNHVETFWRVVE